MNKSIKFPGKDRTGPENGAPPLFGVTRWGCIHMPGPDTRTGPGITWTAEPPAELPPIYPLSDTWPI